MKRASFLPLKRQLCRVYLQQLFAPQQHISKISHMMSLQPQLQVLNMVFSSRQEFFFRSKNRRFGRPENRFYRGEQPESSGLFSFALF